MLRSKSRADSGSEEPSNDRINVVDENNKENANNGVPLSPGGPSMRHKIKQSFTNFASRLTPEETKTVLRKPSPFARASKTDTETAATVPLPESPRSGTPLSNTNSSPSKSPAKSPAKPPSKSRRYLSFLLSPESKYKMDSKTATSLLATTCPAGEVKRKGEAPARDDAEAKSLASIKKEIAGKPAGASILSPPAAAPSPSPVGKENQPTTTTTTTDKAKGMNKLKAKNKTKPATPSSQAAAAATARQPTPIPRSVLAPPAPERQEGSDLTNQITALIGRLSAGETINYQLRNPEGYVDDDPECLDFLNDPECQEFLGNIAPGPPRPPVVQERRAGRSLSTYPSAFLGGVELK